MPRNNNKSKLNAVGKNDARLEYLEEDQSTKSTGKRKKVTGVTIFQREFKKSNKLYSGLTMDNMTLINAAREAFNQLSPLEVQKYEAMASQENRERVEKEGHQWQKDQFGRSMSTLMKESDRLKKWETVDSVEHMKELLSGPEKEVSKRSFIIICTSFYLGSPGHKVPGVDLIVLAEVTLIRFSIQFGCEEAVTLLPKATNVPKNYQGAGVETQEYHGLNMLDNQDIGGVQKVEAGDFVRTMRRFMSSAYSPDHRPPPLFVLGKPYLKVIPKGLEQIYDAAGMDCPFIFPDANYGFCYQLEDFVELLHKRGKQLRGFDVEFSLDRLIPEIPIFNFREAPTNIRIKQCCPAHSFIDRTEQCTRTAAFCHMWWALHSCIGFFCVSPTDSHFPATLLQVWDFERISGESSRSLPSASTSQTSMGSSPAPTPPKSPQRPLPGRGRGVTVEEDPVSRRPGFGRGRGRGLRGRLPTNLD